MENEFLVMDNTQTWHILVEAAKNALSSSGYEIERIPGRCRSNVWKVTKGGVEQLASIRTTRDRWFAFPPLDDKWKTLDDVEIVIVSAVDDPEDPRSAQVYLFSAEEVRERFNAAYEARIEAGQKVRHNFGMWVCLDEDTRGIAASVGSGIANQYDPIAEFTLDQIEASEPSQREVQGHAENQDTGPVTISEVLASAKTQIAQMAGVGISQVKLDLKIEN